MRQTFAVLFLVTISLLCMVEAARNAGLSSAISADDLKNIKDVVLANTNKDWPNNIHTAYYVTSALANLDTIPKQTEIITLAKNTLKSKDKQSVESIFHAASILETLKVSDATVDKAVVDTLKSTIDGESETLNDYYYAGSAALSLRALKLAKEITDDDIAGLVSKVSDLADEDGAFRSSSTDKEGSLYNSGLALQLLARINKDIKLSEEDKEHIDNTVELVESIVSLANEADNILEFPGSDDANALATTSAVFVGLNAFTASTNKPLPEVTPIQVTQIGQFLVNQKHVGTLTDAFHLLNGLRTLQSNVIAIPLAVSLERASIVGTAKGAEGHVLVEVTDVFDKSFTAAKVYLIKAQPAAGKDTHVLLSNQELLLSDDKKTFALNFLAAKPEQGFYTLEFRVVPSDNKYTTVDSTVRTVKVVGSISITDFELTVADSKESLGKSSEGSTYKAADQSKKIDEVIRIDHLQFVNVKFRVRGAGGSNKPVLVQQAFVKFTHAKSGHEAIFVATPNENKVYSALIDVEENAKSQFKSHSGDWKIEVVAGDAFIQNPIHWVVAPNVKIAFVGSATGTRAGLGPLPEIVHKFREPEKRPPLIVSNIATLAVLAPLAFLFIGFIAVGANISRFPFSGTDFIYSVGFLASTGATLGLMGLYWMKLNLVQTLGYLAVLALPNIFFGQRVLSRLAKRKEHSE